MPKEKRLFNNIKFCLRKKLSGTQRLNLVSKFIAEINKQQTRGHKGIRTLLSNFIKAVSKYVHVQGGVGRQIFKRRIYSGNVIQ